MIRSDSKRGEVWWVDFVGASGGEIKKERPVVIVSNDQANRFLNRIQVVPLTSNVAKLYPSEAYVWVNGLQHKALADQITTISKQRISNRMGQLSNADLQAVERVLRIQLGLG